DSEAVETALKVALQFHAARGDSGRVHFIARRQSWHGYTMGALSVSGHLARRRPYEHVLMPVTFAPPPNEDRPRAGVDAEHVTDYRAAELEETILGIGPGKVAAFILEPVVGAAGGAVPPPPGYAQRVREICDRYGVLMIADEVMCGIGRCGSWRALALEEG